MLLEGRKLTQVADLLQSSLRRFCSKMCNAGSAVVGHKRHPVVLGYVFTSNRFYFCGAGNEHFRSVLYHVNEVSQCRAAYTAPPAEGPMIAESEELRRMQ